MRLQKYKGKNENVIIIFNFFTFWSSGPLLGHGLYHGYKPRSLYLGKC
jgi:hypothetical protein